MSWLVSALSIPDLKGGVMLWMPPFSYLEVKRKGLLVSPQPMEAYNMILSQLGIFGWKEGDENGRLPGDCYSLRMVICS